MWINQSSWLQAVLTFACVCVSVAEKIWYEKAPRLDDPCTLLVIGRKTHELQTAHPLPGCTHGGLVWGGVWGRIHSTLIMTLDRTQEFELCLTGGLSESVYVWWDSHRDYWQPLGFQQYHSEITDARRCRPSTNGSIDIYFEAPWAERRYIGYVSWEVRLLTKEEHKKVWYRQEKDRFGPSEEEKTEDEEGSDGENANSDDDDSVNNNKEASSYLVVVLDAVIENVLIVFPGLGLVILGFLLLRLRGNAKQQDDARAEESVQSTTLVTKAKKKQKPVKDD